MLFKLVCLMHCKYNLHSNIFFVYLFSLIKILQTNAGGGNQNMDENIENDFEEEDGSQKENTNSDDD